VTPTIIYALQSSIWALFGLMAGFALGLTVRDIRLSRRDLHRIATAVDGEDPVTDEPRLSLHKWQRVLGGIVFVLSLLTAVQGIYQWAEVRRIADCQSAYSNGFADAIDARTAATGEAQNALDKLMTSVGKVMQSTDPGRRDDVQTAIREYLDARAKAKATQQANPYPPAPRDLCK